MSQVYADLPWRVIVTDKDSVNLALLDHRATNRQFVFTLNGPATHSGQVASDDPIINLPYPGLTDPAYLTNNRRLIYAFRRELESAAPGNVMKSNAAIADAYAEIDFALVSEVWVTCRIEIPAASLAYYEANTSDLLIRVSSGGGGRGQMLIDAGPLWVLQPGSPFGGSFAEPPLADTSQLLEFRFVTDGTTELYVDSVLAATHTSSVTGDVDTVRIGQTVGTSNDPDAVVYFGDVKVGTTRGASDIFADDFSSGDFSAWTTTSGDVSVVADPFATTVSQPYICRFGGILMNIEDEGADAPTSTYTAYDPWQYMMSRPVRDPDTGAIPGDGGLTFPAGSRASDIALALLETTEVVDGETHIDLDGTAAPLVEPTDPLPGATTFEPGLSVGEAWQQLVDTGTIDIVLPPLYDPLKPGKVCQFQTSPRAGETRYDTLFSWDVANHSAAAISRLIDGTRLANKVQFWADTGLPAPLQTDTGSVTDNGQWWAQQFFPGQGGIDWITLAALAALLQRRYGARTITFDPAPERSELPLRDYAIGDYVPVWASRNLREPLGIDPTSFDPDFPGASGYQRIQVIPINVDDAGTTRVQSLSTTKENV